MSSNSNTVRNLYKCRFSAIVWLIWSKKTSMPFFFLKKKLFLSPSMTLRAQNWNSYVMKRKKLEIKKKYGSNIWDRWISKKKTLILLHIGQHWTFDDRYAKISVARDNGFDEFSFEFRAQNTKKNRFFNLLRSIFISYDLADFFVSRVFCCCFSFFLNIFISLWCRHRYTLISFEFLSHW